MKRQFLYRDESNVLVFKYYTSFFFISISKCVQSFVIAWVLEHEHRELSVRRYHDLMLVGPNPNECDVLLWVECFDCRLGLSVELVD
jgi:hypothetical protein